MSFSIENICRKRVLIFNGLGSLWVMILAFHNLERFRELENRVRVTAEAILIFSPVTLSIMLNVLERVECFGTGSVH